jgi:hypothetical protein
VSVTFSRKSALNPDAGLLSLVAAITMVIDHVGSALLPSVPVLRVIGRIAFPLYCMGIVQGCIHTKNHLKYALRLLLFALISQPAYMLGLNHSLKELNVIFTLLLGMLSVWGIQEKRFLSHLWMPAIALTLSAVFKMDYGWRGVLLIILMYLSSGTKSGFSAMFIAFCLMWGNHSFDLFPFLRIPSPFNMGNVFLERLGSLVTSFFRLQTMALLALPLMVTDTHSGIRRSRLVYAIYPGHLIVLWFLTNYVLK